MEGGKEPHLITGDIHLRFGLIHFRGLFLQDERLYVVFSHDVINDFAIVGN